MATAIIWESENFGGILQRYLVTLVVAMSLKLRINVLLGVLLFAVTICGSAVILIQAKRAVIEEVESTQELTSRLLRFAVRLSTASRPNSAPELIEQVQSLGSFRHVRIVPGRSDESTPETDEAPVFPEWFARYMTVPVASEVLTLNAGDHAAVQLTLLPDPTDEVAEIWSEVKASLGTLIGFGLLAVGLVTWMVSRALRPLDRIRLTLDSLERGAYDVRLEAFSLPELKQIAGSVNQLANSLTRHETENRTLTNRLLDVQASERESLARELHDELGQAVAGIKALAVSAERAHQGGYSETLAEITDAITAACDSVFFTIRAILLRLRSSEVEALGFERALTRLVEQWNQRESERRCNVQIEGRWNDIPQSIADTAFRAIQECLTNVSRHANASNVAIHAASRVTDPPTLVVEVTDDGIGFDPQATEWGLGLLGMRERAIALGGSVELISARGAGVTVCLVLPLITEPALNDELTDERAFTREIGSMTGPSAID
ncbi:MAG: ATP-binding protein [Pseudomonadota bacterium]